MSDTTTPLAFYRHFKNKKGRFYATFNPTTGIFQIKDSSTSSFLNKEKMHTIVKNDYRIAERYGLLSFEFYDLDTGIVWSMDLKTFFEKRGSYDNTFTGEQWTIPPEAWQATIDDLPVTLKQDMIKRDVYNKKVNYKQ